MSMEFSLSARCGLTGMVARGGPADLGSPGVSDSCDDERLAAAAGAAAVEVNFEVKLLWA